MAEAPFLSRQERFPLVASTNDVVRGWLAAGTPEVCVAVADEQSAGRGREGRTWVSPAGRALLLSLGFRPRWLAPQDAWRLAATASLAMADAAEEVAGLRDGTVRLKWPNDLVIERPEGPRLVAPSAWPEGPPGRPDDEAGASIADGAGSGGRPSAVRKLGGVLGETEGLGTDDPRVVVGMGVNGDWPAVEFPADLAGAMTSLRDASGGRPIDHAALLEAFLDRLEPRMLALRDGRFDGAGWLMRQVTNDRHVRLARADGSTETVLALGVDPASGALLVEDASVPGGRRSVLSGEIRHVRLAAEAPAGAARDVDGRDGDSSATGAPSAATSSAPSAAGDAAASSTGDPRDGRV